MKELGYALRRVGIRLGRTPGDGHDIVPARPFHGQEPRGTRRAAAAVRPFGVPSTIPVPPPGSPAAIEVPPRLPSFPARAGQLPKSPPLRLLAACARRYSYAARFPDRWNSGDFVTCRIHCLVVRPLPWSLPLLLICLGGVPLGCGSLSHRTSTLDDPELAELAEEQDEAEVQQLHRRPPWRSREVAGDSAFTTGDVALTCGECRSKTAWTPPRNPRRKASPTGRTPRSTARSKGTVEEVDTSRFEDEVLGSDRPVLVDFYADWCGPCKQIAPVLDELAADSPDVKIVKVNIDASRKLAATYQVRTVPTLMVFKQGELVSHHRGLANRKTLEQLLAR